MTHLLKLVQDFQISNHLRTREYHLETKDTSQLKYHFLIQEHKEEMMI